jgi:hypothetical protein
MEMVERAAQSVRSTLEDDRRLQRVTQQCVALAWGVLWV